MAPPPMKKKTKVGILKQAERILNEKKRGLPNVKGKASSNIEASDEESDEDGFMAFNRRGNESAGEDNEVQLFNLDIDDDSDNEEEEEEEEEENDDEEEEEEDYPGKKRTGDEEDSDDDLKQLVKKLDPKMRKRIMADGDDDSDTADDEEDGDGADASWGKKKEYWRGDTADLEIGQDVQDALDEELAAEDLHRKKQQSMQEDDFYDGPAAKPRAVISSGGAERSAGGKKQPPRKQTGVMGDLRGLAMGKAAASGDILVEKINRDITKLTESQQRAIITAESPEVVGLVADLKKSLLLLRDELLPLRELMKLREYVVVPAPVQEYLQTKEQLLLLNCINIEFYLYMRAQGKAMSAHPAGRQLLEIKYAMKSMRQLDERFTGALGVLQHLLECDEAEATAMASCSGYEECMLRGELPEEDEEDDDIDDNQEEEGEDGDDNHEEEGEEEEEDEEGEDDEYDSDEAYRQDEEQYNSTGGARASKGKARAGDIGDIGEYADSSSSSSAAGASGAQRAAIEAALRALSRPTKGAAKKLGAKSDDFLDELTSGRPGKKSKAPLPSSRAADSDSEGFDSDDVSDDYDMFEKGYTSKHKQGVDYTDGDDGYDDDDFAGEELDEPSERKRRRAPAMDDDNAEEAEEEGVFAQFSKKKREFDSKKKEHYSVPARYGGADDSLPSGQKRAASYEIMKNRGLTPHRKKSNRNPRVKKREKYAKAIVARKGQVREVIVGGGAEYGGEMTGIKSNLARSRKIHN